MAFLLRVSYYDRNYGHADETITTEVVGRMRSTGDWDTNWAKANLEPSFKYDQYNFSSHLYATFLFYRVVKLVPGLESWRSRDGGFWVYRFFSVLLATLVVWQTWWLARKVAGDKAGFLAGCIAAVAPLLVQDAHYSRPEAWVTALCTGAAMLCIPKDDYDFRRIFFGSVLIGIAVACKFSLVALVWLPMLPILSEGWNGHRTIKPALGAACLVTLGTAVGFAIGAPNAIINPQVYLHGIKYLAAHYAGLHPPHSNLGGGPVSGMLGGYFLSTLGIPSLIAASTGAGWLLFQRRWSEVFLLAGPLVFFVSYFCTRTVFFERNLSHVVPLFCVLAGVGLFVISDVLALRWRGQILTLTVLLGVLSLIRPFELSWRLVHMGFSGQNSVQVEAIETRLRAAYPNMDWWSEDFMNTEPLTRLIAHFNTGGGQVMLRAIDYHDEWSAKHLKMLPLLLNVELVAEKPSIFYDVTNCTLHTYSSWTDRYYLVNGVQKPH
jgi:hypothetical protein